MTQESFSSLTKLSNIGSRLQKYPKVSKSVRVREAQRHIRTHLQSLLWAEFGIGGCAIPEQSRTVGDQFHHFDANLEALHGSGAHSQQPDTSMQKNGSRLLSSDASAASLEGTASFV